MKVWLVLVYVTATIYVLHSIHDTEDAARRNSYVGADPVDREDWREATYLGQRVAVRVESRWLCVDDAGTFLAAAKRVADQRAEDEQRRANP